jgi:hypothetical protein
VRGCSSAWRCFGFMPSGSLHCSQKHLQIFADDVCHAHLPRIIVQTVQVLFGAGSIELQRGEECFCPHFVSAADNVADRSLHVIRRHRIPGRRFQRCFSEVKQFGFDIVDFALRFDYGRRFASGRNSYGMFKRRAVG